MFIKKTKKPKTVTVKILDTTPPKATNWDEAFKAEYFSDYCLDRLKIENSYVNGIKELWHFVYILKTGVEIYEPFVRAEREKDVFKGAVIAIWSVQYELIKTDMMEDVIVFLADALHASEEMKGKFKRMVEERKKFGF